ncbi:MAG: hypothetical protein H6669_08710 [Ardenticatenaceae bacterium]|nr:hypothetical protein [Ardenticatenaceae bacterium]
MVKEKTKLTLLVEVDLIERAKKYASEHHTSISQLVSRYLASLEQMEENEVELTPRVKSLIGVLPPGPGVEEYQQYLTEKYGG